MTEAFQRNWIECHANDGVLLNKPVRLIMTSSVSHTYTTTNSLIDLAVSEQDLNDSRCTTIDFSAKHLDMYIEHMHTQFQLFSGTHMEWYIQLPRYSNKYRSCKC